MTTFRGTGYLDKNDATTHGQSNSTNIPPIVIESFQNRWLKFCYVPATSAGLPRLFLLQPLTVLMKQTKQAVCAIKQSILLRYL
jgi:hypothetical protein